MQKSENMASEIGILKVPILATDHQEAMLMKLSKSAVQGKASPVPTIRFEEQTLTSFSGLVVFQHL